jgi:MYXO-CTERM domain-containing protein
MRSIGTVLMQSVATVAVYWLADHGAVAQTVFPIANNTATVIAGGSSGVTTDLFDLSQGCKVLSSSPMYVGSLGLAESIFGGPAGFYNDEGNALFADGGAAGTPFFVLFELPKPVMLQSIRLELSQDGSVSRRGTAAYTLEGLSSPTSQSRVLSTASLASNYQDAYGRSNITVSDTLSDPFIGRFFRLTVLQQVDYFAPRVKELDGFGLFDPLATIDVASGTQTQRVAGFPSLTSTVALLKTGGGSLLLDSPNDFSGSTTIAEGSLVLAHSSAARNSNVTVAGGAVLKVEQNIAATVAGLTVSTGGSVDITTGSLKVTSGLTSASLTDQLRKGRGDGTWNGGSGILSTAAAADIAANVPRTIGWLDNGDGSMTFSYAAPGDATLDGQVDILDAAYLLTSRKFGTGQAASWRDGDYNYDGIVDVLDVADFVSTGLFDTGLYNAVPGNLAVVPEPASWSFGIVALALGALGFRRRRQQG